MKPYREQLKSLKQDCALARSRALQRVTYVEAAPDSQLGLEPPIPTIECIARNAGFFQEKAALTRLAQHAKGADLFYTYYSLWVIDKSAPGIDLR